ncbi:O-acyltransferase like protein-like [Anopheles bellator]|uniref:O-acyltransferase like protein-like n=1 Tax=Anopheles bellator TaxID=139047 RepID=UPI002647C978|nr:O-acyltransferase like protein-like [Anopheles bellator]
MPPLFYYENVTDCFARYSASGLYCVVKTVIKPTPGSDLWRTIEKYSQLASYHDHALLDRGLCVDACGALVKQLEPSIVQFLDTERVTTVPYHLLSLPSETELSARRSQYGTLLNICANYKLWQQYNLTGYSEIERCTTKETPSPAPIDGYHVVLATIVLLAIALVVCATVSDRRPERTINNNEIPKHLLDSQPTGPLWLEFSLRRTWRQLVAPPRTILQRDFAFVELFRLLAVFVILAIHVSMCFAAAPIANVRPLEEFFALPVSLVAVSIFPFQVHTFFTISGMLLTVHFLHLASSTGRRIGWSYLGQAITVRYLRIFPLLLVVWLYHVSWFDRLSQGPGDYRYIELEKDNCRANGWLNFLFINNYFRHGNMCMQQSWHLAADFQFFLIGVPFLLLIHRHPRLRKPLIATAICISVVAPIANLYHHQFPGVVLTNFKQLRFVFYAHRVLQFDYMLFHPHTCSYFAGIFAGLAYHRLRNDPSLALPAIRGIWLWKWVPPSLVLLQASFAPLFYDLDYRRPMLWNAVYGAVHRCSWGTMCAVGILYGATAWRGRYAPIHRHPVVLLLSRLSFGVFMVQFCVLKSLARNAGGFGIEFSWKIYFQSVVYSWVGCYAAALVLALLVEFPCAAICKRLLSSQKHGAAR